MRLFRLYILGRVNISRCLIDVEHTAKDSSCVLVEGYQYEMTDDSCGMATVGAHLLGAVVQHREG